MTQEQKAQAYDEALGWMREMYPCLTDSLREDAEHYFPELAESEDERIRKFLIQHISEWIGCIEHDLKNSSKDIESEKELAMFKAGLAYLEKQKEQNDEDEFLEDELSAFLQNYDKEYDDDAAVSDVARHFYEIGKKQKEQKPNYCLYGGYPNVGRCRWCYAACSARLADVHTDEEKEYIRTIKSIISDFIRDKKPENLAYYQRIYDWLDGRHVPFSCGHENGEPADPVFSKQEYESHPIISTDTTSAKPVEFDGKTLLYTADKSYQIGFRDGVASVKPAEWSDADNIGWDEAFACVTRAEKAAKNEEELQNAVTAEKWLKEIKFKYYVHPVKQEWSEEDENALEYIHDLISWGYSKKFMDAQTAHDMRKWVNEHLRPDTFQNGNSHWKPSEEQMDTLKNVAYGTYQNGDGPALRELYEQLVKNYKL